MSLASLQLWRAGCRSLIGCFKQPSPLEDPNTSTLADWELGADWPGRVPDQSQARQPGTTQNRALVFFEGESKKGMNDFVSPLCLHMNQRSTSKWMATLVFAFCNRSVPGVATLSRHGSGLQGFFCFPFGLLNISQVAGVFAHC